MKRPGHRQRDFRVRLPLLGWVMLSSAIGCGSGEESGTMMTPMEIRQQARQAYPDYRVLHEFVVTPVCGPRGGVCHNSKQFPDLHTPDNMLGAVGARCNQLTDDPLAIQDLCEGEGDWLVVKSPPLAGWRSRIGYAKVGDTMTPPRALVITIKNPAPMTAMVEVAILRDGDPEHTMEIPLQQKVDLQVGQKSVRLANFNKMAAGLRTFLLSPYTPGAGSQLFLGDPNRNGSFGFDLHGAVVAPGRPEKSFLVQRILGIVPPQMPIANGTLTPVQIYALQCWVAQMTPDGSNADGPIDYAKCPVEFQQ